ncbi:hypothetical protein [Lacrimispora amygdalina]|uniref:hypothetical protein n=1 Tax=Lacrimispora amygdalina TaxID=253257 RepID=UPI000BE46F0D|nr:hypothetical protein [Lacrimispora amygdalina]
MSYGKDKQKEIDTIKERNIILKLSDADVQRIWEKAGSVGLSVSELFKNFVGDLVDGTYSNGSDERDLVNQWFDRCGFGMFPDKTLLCFLIDRGYIEDFVELCDDIKNSEEHITITKKAIDTGIMEDRNGTYTWEDLMTGDNKPAYSSREQWEKQESEYIEQEQDIINDCQDQINEYWNDYLKFVDVKLGTLEEEIEKVIIWYDEMERMIGKNEDL